MGQSLVSLLVHVVFSTKNRVELNRPETEEELYPYMCGILRNHGSPCLAINGTADHVHMLISMSKNIGLADLMEDLKKDSSKWIKTQGARYKNFHWQDGYAGFSIGQSGMPQVKKYIARQNEHHKKTSFQDELIGFVKEIRDRLRRKVYLDISQCCFIRPPPGSARISGIGPTSVGFHPRLIHSTPLGSARIAGFASHPWVSPTANSFDPVGVGRTFSGIRVASVGFTHG